MPQSMNQLVITRALEQVKQRLNERGIQYQALARQFDVSVNTIKRMLNGDDISMQRLLMLAEICDLNVEQLLSNATQQHAEHTYISDRQDAAFAEDPALFTLFTRLFYEQTPLTEVVAKLGLDEIETYQYLRTLEDIELLELSPGNRFRFLVSPPLGFKRNSRVLRQQINNYLDVAKQALNADQPGENQVLLVKPMQLPAETFQQLCLDLRAVIDKYAEASEVIFRNNADLTTYQVTLVASPSSLPEVIEQP
ncbi:MAG: helix-turn-helix transcriptional regulator [Idiomarina sp.]|nr:helix-turn-helix transcriptional regulator [Idiomarina sp.]